MLLLVCSAYVKFKQGIVRIFPSLQESSLDLFSETSPSLGYERI